MGPGSRCLMEWIHLVGFFFFHFNFLCISVMPILYICASYVPLEVELQMSVSFFVGPLALGE